MLPCLLIDNQVCCYCTNDPWGDGGEWRVAWGPRSCERSYIAAKKDGGWIGVAPSPPVLQTDALLRELASRE